MVFVLDSVICCVVWFSSMVLSDVLSVFIVCMIDEVVRLSWCFVFEKLLVFVILMKVCSVENLFMGLFLGGV